MQITSFFHSRDCVFMGPYNLSRNLQNGTPSRSDHSIHFPAPPSAAFVIFPLMAANKLSASWVPSKYSRCFGLLLSFADWVYLHWFQMWQKANKQLSTWSRRGSSCNSDESSLTMSPSSCTLALSTGSMECASIVLGSCQPDWWALIAGMQLAASNYAGTVKLDAFSPSRSLCHFFYGCIKF